MSKLNETNITEKQKKEILEYNNCIYITQMKMFEVLKLRAEGKQVQEIADITGYTAGNVRVIIRRYTIEGLNELMKNKLGAHNRKLTKKEERELLEPFKIKAQQGEKVTRKEIQKEFEKVTKERTSKNTIYDLLHRHNWKRAINESTNNYWLPEEIFVKEINNKLEKHVVEEEFELGGDE